MHRLTLHHSWVWSSTAASFVYAGFIAPYSILKDQLNHLAAYAFSHMDLDLVQVLIGLMIYNVPLENAHIYYGM